MLRRFALASTIATVAVLAGAVFTPTAEAQRRGVRVNIESSPAGAAVFVDSPDTPSIGTAPLALVRVPRGRHVLIFRLANHEEGRLEVNVRRRRETFRIVLEALSTLDVRAGNSAASGAAIRIDGEPVGNVPFRTTLQPGRHLVQVGREGHVTFTEWVNLDGAQAMTMPVSLELEAPRTGSLLVAGDVSGATVYVDGSPRGTTPAMIESLPEGEHSIEVRPSEAGLQPFRQTVRIVAGERQVLNPQLRPTRPVGGSLRVLANAPGAVISLDGEALGEAPASSEGVAPGEHIIEAHAEGYEDISQPVTIEDGRQRVVSLRMVAVAQRPGRIVVNANVDGATVTIDGEDRGPPPVVIESATAGTHAIAVSALGHEEFRVTCRVSAGENCEIDAELMPIGTPVRVVANVRSARFFIDGDEVGPVPWEGTLPIGSHHFEVRASGHRAHIEQIALRSSNETRVFNIALVGQNELTLEEREERRDVRRRQAHEAVSRAAGPLPADLTVMDFSLGWPYIADFRLSVGILSFLEAGFGVRTSGRLTDFVGRVKVGARPIRQISVGAQLSFGGGIGPARDLTAEENLMFCPTAEPCDMGPEDHPTNSLFMSIDLMMSLHFSRAGVFSLWFGGDFTRDSWDWVGNDSDQVYRADGGMGDIDRSHQGTARARVGGSLEIVLSRRWNIWAQFEGIAAGNQRRILGDLFGAGHEDTEMYGRLGFTYKFGPGGSARPRPAQTGTLEPAPAPAPAAPAPAPPAPVDEGLAAPAPAG